MKSSAIIFLIVALLASVALSVPSDYKDYNQDKDFNKYCKDIEFIKPVDGIIYKINSTQVADFVIPKDCLDKFGRYKFFFFFFFFFKKKKKNFFFFFFFFF